MNAVNHALKITEGFNSEETLVLRRGASENVKLLYIKQNGLPFMFDTPNFLKGQIMSTRRLQN